MEILGVPNSEYGNLSYNSKEFSSPREHLTPEITSLYNVSMFYGCLS